MNEENCIFCKIIRGEMPSSVIFEDEQSIAFMDVFPLNEGHCLLIPKKHYVNMFDVDPDVIAHLAKNLADLTKRVQKATGAEGVLNIVANGEGAGQDVFHLHLHAIPRNKSSQFGFKFPSDYMNAMAPREDLDRMAEKIREST
ncbi:MAG: HIT family protein [Candidatus Thorarchaeota archaeon]|jgi:histidine triad (HIT) family protein